MFESVGLVAAKELLPLEIPRGHLGEVLHDIDTGVFCLDYGGHRSDRIFDMALFIDGIVVPFREKRQSRQSSTEQGSVDGSEELILYAFGSPHQSVVGAVALDDDAFLKRVMKHALEATKARLDSGDARYRRGIVAVSGDFVLRDEPPPFIRGQVDSSS